MRVAATAEFWRSREPLVWEDDNKKGGMENRDLISEQEAEKEKLV